MGDNILSRISGIIGDQYSRFSERVSVAEHPLLTVILIGVAIRVLLIPFSFNADLHYWGWISNIIDNDLGLYDTEGYYYGPVWGYVLAISGFVFKFLGVTDYGALIEQFVPYINSQYSTFEFVMTPQYSLMVKVPLIITDVIVSLLLYRFVLNLTEDRTKAVMASALWLLCPLTILESSVHGMMDNMSAMFLLLTFIMAYRRDYFFAGLAFAVSMFVKIFPVCFAFLLVVYVFKKEKGFREGIRKLLYAVAGYIVGFVIINYPSIISGNIWETMRFLTDRLGLYPDDINRILPLSTLVIILIVAIAAISILCYLTRDRLVSLGRRISEMDPKVRDRRVSRVLIVLTVIGIVAIMGYSLLKTSGGVDGSSLVMRVAVALALVSVSLSIYVAYRFAFSGELKDSSLFTCFMLTSCFLFIWMPLPQYPVAVLPMIIMFALLVDRRFIVPYIGFTICMFLYQTAMGGITALYSVASFTDILSLDWVLSMLDAYANSSLPIQINAITAVLAGAAAYISLIYMPFKWLKNNSWGRSQ